MSLIYKLTIGVLFITAFVQVGVSQPVFKGKIIDAVTKEPVAGATVHCSSKGCSCGCATNAAGEFELTAVAHCCISFAISSVGYQTALIQASQLSSVLDLQQVTSAMQSVVVTASRETIRRSLAPVAIVSISSRMIQDAKPSTIDQVLNKVSGVYMVNLGNEQHSMSIRQPMTTKSLFLYLEDGIPIRTSGLFNHNALLEINMAAVKNIEVIKGPSSSLYGSEAIGGVVNFITASPTAVPLAKLSLQANSIGYKRADMQTGFITGKWGFALSGYHAGKENSFMEYTRFHKTNVSARVDYRLSENTSLTNTITWLDYYSDMTGGIDSAKFKDRSFGSTHSFTYRQVKTLRTRSTFSHTWNGSGKTTATVIFRNNTIGQNPAYSVKDDYRPLSNGTWTGHKDVAHGEINEVAFKSYALFIQHRQRFNWKNSVLVSGLNADFSPSGYQARYIRINKDSVSKKYTHYQTSDSLLTSYKNNINNYAAFINFEFSPAERLRLVLSLRYDMFKYKFDNKLAPSSYSGSPDMTNRFGRISPKIGFTYNLNEKTGMYANYSQGFVPPQVTEMYRGVKVPVLNPSVFHNYEIGGWLQLVKDVLSADISLYMLGGTNEIISVKLDDGSTENRNAGKTSHQGIEVGVNANPVKSVSIRFSGAFSKHTFTRFVEKGISYNGNEMNGAPHWMHNSEIWYKPFFAKGLRFGLEWQRISNYFMDPLNTVQYEGYDVFHLRAGYKFHGIEFWINLMNAGDKYYAYTASKSNFGYSYTPAEPRHFTAGISYDLGELFKIK